MSKRIIDLEESLIIDDQDEILFFQNSTKRSKKIKRGNFFNSRGISVRGRFVDSVTGNDVYYVADLAATNAALAQATANGAQTSADGKAKVYYQTTEPTGGTYNAGDLWYDTDDNYKLYVRSGSSWVASFAPMIKLGANNNISGLIKADGTDKDFVLIADKFQIWNGVSAEVPFEIVGGNVYIKNAQIQTVDAGKLTAGFISSQVIELSDSGAYIQSSVFIETWVTGKLYKTTRTVPSDQTKVKVLQNDGTYLVYNCAVQHTSGATFAADLAASKWTLASPQPSVQGFRIIGSGEAEFQDVIIRGTVYATTGYFGNTSSVVSVDAGGLVVGSSGVIKSSGTTWTNSGGTGTFGGSSGFYLGYTPGPNVYQFYIGSSSRYLRWDGTNLRINGNLVNGTTIGGASGSEGLLRGVDNAVLTINGGSANGIQYGSQIDLVGTDYTAISDAQGLLILQAGWKTGFSGGDGSLVLRTSKGSTVDSKDVGVDRLTIEADGTVTVVGGTSSIGGAPNGGAGKLVVETSVTAPTYTSTSSKRFKKKIKNLKNGLEIVSKLRPVVFDWKTKDLKNDIGLIAEEVNEIVPNLVGLDNKGEVVGIDYSKLTPILIQAVKELSLEIEKLKKKIN
jgi:Chaperone of endosialidase